MDNKILKKIKEQLPHGAIKIIAERMDLSPATISCVLNGKLGSSKKPEIIKTAVEYLEEYTKRENVALEAANKFIIENSETN